MPTPTQVYEGTRRQINESSTKFLTEAGLYQFMWEAELEIADEVGCAETTDSSISSAVGTREYDMPTGCMQVLRLEYDSYPLVKIDLTELDKYEGIAYAKTAPTGNVMYYYMHGDIVGLSPVPDAIKVLKFWTVSEPTALDSASTAFTIPNAYSGSIYNYCLWKHFDKDGEYATGQRYHGEWEAAKEKLKVRWQRKKLGDMEFVVKDADVYENRIVY